ncbi:MAG: 3-phosphoserine/phosphohydroxythreonine transaminase [Erysipelotrichaceae bacterium]|nr:3-phosphoserine/phosphohydroxythreonine transaminase [Erysipelotrichaceae bacterium]
MYDRIYNFAAGPSQLPLEVLEEIHKDLFNYKGTGMSVMEMSHRSKMYLEIFNETKENLRKVMDIPEDYEILFIQGGATEQFAAIPLNFFKNNKADYIVTGAFSKKAAKEAAKFGEVNVIYDAGPDYDHIPTNDQLKFNDDADYVYICANNTIYGTEWHEYPKCDKPLIADMSSDICSHVINVRDFGMIYAGVQKNLGIAGLALVIIRKDLIDGHKENIPQLFEYDNQVKNDSMINTPPTFAIYVLGLMAKWILSKGGVKELEEVNKKKAKLLYDLIDEDDFYKGHARKDSRSLMNVTFNLANEELEAKFVKEAKAAGMENLKGHRSVGGIRASIYNAMPMEGVEKLVAFMKEFKENNK